MRGHRKANTVSSRRGVSVQPAAERRAADGHCERVASVAFEAVAVSLFARSKMQNVRRFCLHTSAQEPSAMQGWQLECSTPTVVSYRIYVTHRQHWTASRHNQSASLAAYHHCSSPVILLNAYSFPLTLTMPSRMLTFHRPFWCCTRSYWHSIKSFTADSSTSTSLSSSSDERGSVSSGLALEEEAEKVRLGGSGSGYSSALTDWLETEEGGGLVLLCGAGGCGCGRLASVAEKELLDVTVSAERAAAECAVFSSSLAAALRGGAEVDSADVGSGVGDGAGDSDGIGEGKRGT